MADPRRRREETLLGRLEVARELLQHGLDLRLHEALNRCLHPRPVRRKGETHPLTGIMGALIRQLNLRAQPTLLLLREGRPGQHRLGLRLFGKAGEREEEGLAVLRLRVKIEPVVFWRKPLSGFEASRVPKGIAGELGVQAGQLTLGELINRAIHNALHSTRQRVRDLVRYIARDARGGQNWRPGASPTHSRPTAMGARLPAGQPAQPRVYGCVDAILNDI